MLNAADIEMVKISLACVFPNSVILKVSEQIRAAKSELPKLPKKGSQEKVTKQGCKQQAPMEQLPRQASQERFPSTFPSKVPKFPKQGS